MNKKSLLLAAVGVALLLYYSSSDGLEASLASNISEDLPKAEGPYPTNLRKCSDRQYTLNMSKFNVDLPIVTGNFVTTSAIFTPKASGIVDIIVVTIYYRDLEIFSFNDQIRDKFTEGKEYVLKYPRLIPTRIPKIAVKVKLSLRDPADQELSCAGFDLNFGTA